MRLKELIGLVPDFPKPGVLFRDLTSLLADAEGFREAAAALAEPFSKGGVDFVAGIEARGFILAGVVAIELKAGFIPLRKGGKLPGAVLGEDYKLEYGEARLELREGTIPAGADILLIDDLIATGGTSEAAVKLLRRAGGKVIEAGFVVELPDLGGRKKIEAMNVPVRALCAFPGG